MATAPIWACAHGTAVPAEKYRDCTATPRFLVLGSKATIEKVEAKWFGLSIRTSLRRFLFYAFLLEYQKNNQAIDRSTRND